MAHERLGETSHPEAAINFVVLIPAFNEADRLGAVIRHVRTVVGAAPVVVIDDGSADATAQVARAAGAVVLRLPVNMGYGVALQTGYKYAVREGFELVVQLDADGQHEPADIPALLAVVAAGDADVALGSRFMAGTYTTGRTRRAALQVLRTAVFLFTGARLSDVTSGFQALSGDVARFFTTERYPGDYPDADVLIMLERAGFRVKEVPVRMYARPAGRSMHGGLRPIYYMFKMLLSVSLAPLRRDTAVRKAL